jgi:SAM-dependent methyltransferase
MRSLSTAVSFSRADLYTAALHSMRRPGAARHWYSRWENGERSALGADLSRWCGTVDATDLELLRRTSGAVLAIGCGPGRLVAELTRPGRQAAGLDTSPTAVTLARQSTATVLRRSVFDPVSGEGLWDTVLLADGNVGIGGTPTALLGRCRELIGPQGRVLVEVEAFGAGLRTGRVRLESDREAGAWFPWARVGLDALDEPAACAGLRVDDAWTLGGRSFAGLALRPAGITAHRPLEGSAEACVS